MIFGSVCSGIDAASVAWSPLGWRAAFLSEIDKFPREVLRHHYPEVPLHGDFTTINASNYEPIDLLVGGTPCQDFSVAGLRAGMAGDRGNLTLQFLTLARRLRPRWVVWENVPGVLSSNGGRDFGAFLGGLGELGYGWAYRTLDAQFFGVAQRRRRVFVVGYLGDWRRAAAVLFERHCLSGYPAPSRQAGQRPTPTIGASTGDWSRAEPGESGLVHAPLISPALKSRDYKGPSSDGDGDGAPLIAHSLRAQAQASHHADTETYVTHSLRGDGFDASEDGTGRGVPLVPIAFSSKDHGADAESDLSPTLRAGGHDGTHANAGVPPAIAFALRGREAGAVPEVHDQISALRAASGGSSRDYIAFNITPSNSNKDYNARESDRSQAITSHGNRPSARGGDLLAVPLQEVGKRTGVSTDDIRAGVGIGEPSDPMFTLQAGAQRGVGLTSAVRRLTPRECERLQGFPDDYTLIPWRRGFAADGPRYKALGNSMAVPVMAWIGRRIEAVERLP